MATETMAAKLEAEFIAENFTGKLVAFTTADGRSWTGEVTDVQLDYIKLQNFGLVDDEKIRYPPIHISGASSGENWHIAIAHIVSWGILA